MNFIVDIVMEIWSYIKHIFTRVLNFTKNIVNFFRNSSRLRKLQEDKDLIAVAVKNNLDNGNYNTINCLFDKSTNEVVDMEEDAIGIESESIDDETENAFADKDMIIIQ